MTLLTPQWMQKKGYTAKSDRQFIEAAERGATGVHGYGDFLASAGGAMTVSVSAGDALVRGTTNALQGTYRCKNDAAVNVAVSTADGTNPRIDQLVLKILDDQEAGGGSNIGQLAVVAGTPTGGATLDNRSGVAALPASCILLADLNITAGLATILAANIRDRRPIYSISNTGIMTAMDQVTFLPAPGTLNSTTNQTHSNHDTYQAAALMYLPRRIVSATRIRWRYIHGATANTGNYVLAVYDASMRKIIDTGTVAFTGAANSVQARSETISATSFDAGMYWVFSGWDTSAAGGSVVFQGIGPGGTNAAEAAGTGGMIAQAQNQFVRVTSGGVTVPTTLAALTDVGGQTSAITTPGVPVVALSVG